MSVTPLVMPNRPVAPVLPVRLAYSTATGDRPRSVPAQDRSCAGCDGEISKSAAVRLWGCPWCAM